MLIDSVLAVPTRDGERHSGIFTGVDVMCPSSKIIEVTFYSTWGVKCEVSASNKCSFLTINRCKGASEVWHGVLWDAGRDEWTFLMCASSIVE